MDFETLWMNADTTNATVDEYLSKAKGLKNYEKKFYLCEDNRLVVELRLPEQPWYDKVFHANLKDYGYAISHLGKDENVILMCTPKKSTLL